jgi:hypothetical protein
VFYSVWTWTLHHRVKLVQKFPTFYGSWNCISVYNMRSLDIILSQCNAVSRFTYYSCKINFSITLNSVFLFLSGTTSKILYAFFTSSVYYSSYLLGFGTAIIKTDFDKFLNLVESQNAFKHTEIYLFILGLQFHSWNVLVQIINYIILYIIINIDSSVVPNTLLDLFLKPNRCYCRWPSWRNITMTNPYSFNPVKPKLV